MCISVYTLQAHMNLDNKNYHHIPKPNPVKLFRRLNNVSEALYLGRYFLVTGQILAPSQKTYENSLDFCACRLN